jgi:hypothetical protein
MNPKLLPQGRCHGLRWGMKNKKGKLRDITYSFLNLIFGEDNVVSIIDDPYKWGQAL